MSTLTAWLPDMEKLNPRIRRLHDTIRLASAAPEAGLLPPLFDLLKGTDLWTPAVDDGNPELLVQLMTNRAGQYFVAAMTTRAQIRRPGALPRDVGGRSRQ